MFRVVGVGCPFVCHMPIRWAWMCVCVCARARHSVRSRPFICAFRISHLYFGISLFTPNLYCSMYLWSARLSFFGVCSFVRILLRLLFLLCVSKVTDVGSFFLSLILFIHSSENPTRMNRIIIYERLLFEFSFIFGHFFSEIIWCGVDATADAAAAYSCDIFHLRYVL